MDKYLLTIIIPTYNNYKLLDECLQSIVVNKTSEVEILVVNDGSTDSTLECLEKYVNYVRVINKENGGVSSARNIGLLEAKGKFVSFVDSDDILTSTAINNMLDCIKYRKINEKLVFTDITVENYIEDKKVYKKWYLSGSDIMKCKNYLAKFVELLISTDMLNSPCGRIYDLQIIKENDIKFPNDLHCGEDGIFNLKYILKCKDILFINSDIYIYRLNISENSSIKKQLSLKIFDNVVKSLDYKMECINSIDASDKEKEDLKNGAYSNAVSQIFNYIRLLKKTNDVYILRDFIKRNISINEILKTKKIKGYKNKIKKIYIYVFLNFCKR